MSKSYYQLEKENLKLRRELYEARQYAERLYHECKGNARNVACAFCGHEYGEGTPKFQNDTLTEHIKVCPKHPMRQIEFELEEYEKRISLMDEYAERFYKKIEKRECGNISGEILGGSDFVLVEFRKMFADPNYKPFWRE